MPLPEPRDDRDLIVEPDAEVANAVAAEIGEAGGTAVACTVSPGARIRTGSSH